MFGLGRHRVDINSTENQNPDPDVAVYPRVSAEDAPYSLPEGRLRAAIFIPADFQFGRDGKTPVILVPGTGAHGGETFENNFAKLLKTSSFGDPVWLNVPGRMCDEAPRNAEHVAYAINYLFARTGKPAAVAAWSQGNLSMQWALKYWPSTRERVNNFICLSADFRGTINAFGLVPVQGAVPGTPAVWHQTRTAGFIATLRSNGGDSAYVPTTSIYSATDEVVQPQFGKAASALMNDARGVGVTNCQLQVHARLRPAGLAYSHETVMANPLAWALAEDAIKNGGPGRFDRIDMNAVCMHRKTPGLSIVDEAKTAALMGWALKAILMYTPKPWREPPLPAYAAAEKTTYVAEDMPVPPTPPALPTSEADTAMLAGVEGR